MSEEEGSNKKKRKQLKVLSDVLDKHIDVDKANRLKLVLREYERRKNKKIDWNFEYKEVFEKVLTEESSLVSTLHKIDLKEL